ncbi:MAG: hypothetical protein Q9184_001743 [Pyrenodesmia sp. 2 TL-2023]
MSSSHGQPANEDGTSSLGGAVDQNMAGSASPDAPSTFAVSGMLYAVQEVANTDKGKKRAAAEAPYHRFSGEEARKEWAKRLRVRTEREATEKAAAKKKATDKAAVDKLAAAQAAVQHGQAADSSKATEGSTMDIDKQDIGKPEPFDFKSIPRKEARIKVAVSADNHEAVSQFLGGRPGYDVFLRINGGKFGDPSITLEWRINTEDTEKPFSVDRPHVKLTRSWEPAERTNGTDYDIDDFVEKSWQDYAKANPDPAFVNHPFMKVYDPSKGGDIRTISFSARGGIVSVPPGADIPTLVGFMDELTQTTLISTLTAETPFVLRFFFMSPGSKYTLAFDPFHRCVKERRGLFHQYRENGTGKFLLEKIHKAQTVKEVGDGMYAREDASGYAQLPVKENAKNLVEFLVPQAVHPIREGQYLEGRDSLLRDMMLECFVYQPRKTLWNRDKTSKGKGKEKDQSFRNYVLAFVRLPSKNKVELMPEVGSSVALTFAPTSKFYHEKMAEEKPYRGLVVPRESRDFETTLTDFCVCLQVPASRGIQRFTTLSKKANLPVASVSVIHNIEPLERELAAVNAMMKSQNPMHLEFLKHLAMNTERTEAIQTTIDLSQGPPPKEGEMQVDAPEAPNGAYNYMEYIVHAHLKNESQNAVFTALRNVKGRHMGVVGPSGTGKTGTIKYGVWLNVVAGHKVAVCAPSNNVLDYNTHQIMKAKALLDMPKLEECKVMRLGVAALEKMRKARGQKTDGHSWRSRPSPSTLDLYVDEVVWENDDVLDALSYLVAEHDQDMAKEKEFQAFLDEKRRMTAYVAAMDATGPRPLDVPYETTLPYWIDWLCHKDAADADAEYKEELARTEVTKRGDVIPASDRNKSKSYMDWKNHWLKYDGRLDAKGMEHLLSARREMEKRVMAMIDVLVVTLNNAGSDFADLGFNPTVLFVDEAAQASFPGLFVPMITWKSLMAILMFGDPQQLNPPQLAKALSEVLDVGKRSPLEVAYKKKTNVFILKEQYRMSPAIHSFPSRQFYNGELICHPDNALPNADKTACKKVALDWYGIKGESEQKDGSECFMINVTKGAARVEPNGTSLQNHANADVISLLLDRLLGAGIDPSDIVLLTMYKAQMKLIASKIERTEDGGVKWHDMSTVDAFQSKQRSVVIFDLVVAKAYEHYEVQNLHSRSAPVNVDEDNGEEEGLPVDVKGGKKYGHVTAFARDYHRLCVGLTRAMNGLIIVGQIELMLNTTDKTRNQLWNTLSALARDMHSRKLIYHDKEHTDTHPVAIEEREAMSEAEKERLEALTSDENRFRFINEWVKKGHAIVHDKNTAPNELFGAKPDPDAQPQPQPRPKVAQYQAARNQPRGRGQGPNRGGGRQRGQGGAR